MFSFFSPQAIHFGRGQSQKTVTHAQTFGKTVLIVHGADRARSSWLIQLCDDAGMTTRTTSCHNEPRLADIELALEQFDGFHPDVIIAVGGGSVIDFGKAVAALIPADGSTLDHLEIVGAGRPLLHSPIPMIAIPTTAGTGAEVTKNAVISIPERGLKVSLRDARMIPDVAIVDPDLMQGAPKHVTLAAGLDAMTQVIEPYLSVKATPMTDAICAAAIPVGLRALRGLVEDDASDAWDKMAWVSTCGGLALANSGLGAVHGFAGVIGGMAHAPHGEICGRLLPEVLESHLDNAQDHTVLHRRLQWIVGLIDLQFADGTRGAGIEALRTWSKSHGLRGLTAMGLSMSDYERVAAAAVNASSMKGNPFQLSTSELLSILQAAR